MNCKKDINKEHCNCTYEPCSRKGVCCECLSYHLRNRELPGCCFNTESEATYNRSFEHFAKLVSSNKV